MPLRSRAHAHPLAVVFTAVGAKTVVAAQPNQQLSVDTSIAGASVVFPALTPAIWGQRFVIIKPTAANFITCSCQDASVRRNGTTFPTIGALGVTVFYCDKYGYYT